MMHAVSYNLVRSLMQAIRHQVDLTRISFKWGLHFASLFTVIVVVVTFSWWHVNFLGVGLHNYGFTAGKNAIWGFYIAMLVVLTFGMIAMMVEKALADRLRRPEA